ncbi:hypothetical protein ABID62_008360 [Bradyrhizobium sp. S3.9.1]
MLKVARDKPQYIVDCGRAAILFLSVDNILPIGQANSRFDNCFGGKSVNRTVLNAEDVTRQIKGHDLPPTVSQQLIASNRSAVDLVEVIDRLCVSKDLGTALIFEFAARDSVTGERIQPARA